MTLTWFYTQGHKTKDEWVTAFKLQYLSADGSAWVTVTQDGSDAVFQGNWGKSGISLHFLPSGVVTRGVRLLPVSWYGAISLRWQVYGC